MARKVLMGGLVTARTGGGNDTCYAEASGSMSFIKNYKDIDDITPLSSATTYTYTMTGGKFTVNGTSYTIVVYKDMVNYPDEASNFVMSSDKGYTLGGVLQKVGDKARWANMWFYNNSQSHGGFP